MKKILSLLLVWLVLSPLSLAAEEAAAKKGIRVDSNQPIRIVSDRLEAFSEKKMVVFSGNAVAVQGDRTIHADRLILFYRKADRDPDRPEKVEKGGEEKGPGDIERVEAKGHVRVIQGARVVTGEEAVFYQEEQRVVMTGNAVMREGANVIRGQKIVVFLNENRGVVEADPNKRVTATIYPSEKKDRRK